MNDEIEKEFLNDDTPEREIAPFEGFIESLRKTRPAEPMRTTEDTTARNAREFFRQEDARKERTAQLFAKAVRVASKTARPEDLMKEIREEIQ